MREEKRRLTAMPLGLKQALIDEILTRAREWRGQG